MVAVDNGLVVENYLRNFSTDMVGDLEFRDGHVIIGDAPGLGIEWDEDLIEKYGEKH